MVLIPPSRKIRWYFYTQKQERTSMYKEELQEQITRCREMQSKCRIDDIDTFIRLSNRIEELTGKIDKTEKQLVVPVQNDDNKIEMF